MPMPLKVRASIDSISSARESGPAASLRLALAAAARSIAADISGRAFSQRARRASRTPAVSGQ